MTLGITASYNADDQSPGVDLTITGVGAYANITVERIDNTGTYPVARVRGLDNAPVLQDTILTADLEAPIGLELQYRAIGSDFDPAITRTGEGALSEGVTSASPSFAAGSVANDIHLMPVLMKPHDATVATPAGWTLVTSKISGTNPSGEDSGSVVLYLFKIEGAQTGSVSLSATGSNLIGAKIVTYQKNVSLTWDVVAVSGSSQTSDSGHTATATSSLTPQVGDVIFVATGINANVPEMNPLITLPGSNLGNTTKISTNGITFGDDAMLCLADAEVSSSTASGAPTIAWASTDDSLWGSDIFVKLSVTAASSETAESSALTIPYSLTGEAWLKSVFTPTLSRKVTVNEYPEIDFETQILGEYNVLGRVHPIVITDSWGSRTGEFKLLTGMTDFTAFKELKDLVTSGGTLVFQTTGDLASIYPDKFFEVKKYSVSREEVVRATPEPLFIHTIQFIEVDRPNTSDAGFSLRTYQDVRDAFATYQDAKDAYGTYLELLAG